jgi:hypothetical protein
MLADQSAIAIAKSERSGRSTAMTDVGRMSVGELLGRVLADEHADLSCDAGCCLAQRGREAEVTAATDAGYGQRNPGPARAASRPRRTPRRRGDLG